ncbi:MAG: hypothetical protein NW215_14550 [Hyphomicrobiales bacterium]|nr:hypothetical protein [Hyphomicrobiales bacterium]
MQLSARRIIGRFILAVALLLSTIPHSHAAGIIDHAASLDSHASFHGHHHDDDGLDGAMLDHGHSHTVADHVHEKPCPVAVLIASCAPSPMRWLLSAKNDPSETRLSRLDRPPRHIV